MLVGALEATRSMRPKSRLFMVRFWEISRSRRDPIREVTKT
ncbi:MAG: hypothetical protein JW384_00125 [Nitrosomonadaceae bacterium]|nr:hypothetical protein [Nitrosomonadaceae bacterium]